tara:strand:+ start:66 stop:239 length:174 start_codon:yes stop_codon:yes gene_type:complete
MSGSVKENIKNDRKRRSSEYRGGGKGKDTITPTTTEDMLELQRIYKYNLRKRGLKGA